MHEDIMELLALAYADGYNDGEHRWGWSFSSLDWSSRIDKILSTVKEEEK